MVNLPELEAMVEQGYVRKVVHPQGHLELYNYSEQCTYEGLWNETTRQCRGLILDLAGNVVARPFRKFFNHGEPNAPELDLDAPVTVTDKLDGSMGTLYYDGTAWSFATRGSFTSDQALHATEVWRERYESAWLPPAGTTCIFEICYPANRIVVNYGDLDDLILLGARDIATGDEVDSRILEWPGPATEVHPYATLREALEAPPRPGQEGLVVFFPDSGDRLKLKQEEYVRAHALVTRMSTTVVWEALSTGIGIDVLLADHPSIPDEIYSWVSRVADALQSAKTSYMDTAQSEFDALPKEVDRKTFALAAKDSPHAAALFRLLDGKEIESLAWKAIRPDWRPAIYIPEDIS